MTTHHFQPGKPPPRGRTGPRRQGSTARLQLEVLEDRTALSATPAPVISLQGLAVGSSYDSHDILVQFRAGVVPHALPGTSLGAALPGTAGLYKIALGTGTNVSAALKEYRADQGVLKAEADYYLGVAATPNDPSFSQQWALQNTGQGGGKSGADIHVTQAWNVTTGSNRVIVSVMDTGIDYNHPDLYQNIWINQKEIPQSRLNNLVDYYHDGFISMRDLNDPRNQGVGKITDLNGDGRIDGGDLLAPMVKDSQGHDTGKGGWADGISQDGSGYVDDLIGWNFFNNTNNPYDDFGHGTHVAGTIGATGNNNLGVTGIDWNVQLMPVKFLGSGGGGTVSQFISALNFAVNHGAKISNNSWSGASYSSVLADAINNAGQHGVIFVAAAGNYSANNDTQPVYPASFKANNIVTVAASDNNDNLASFSDYGRQSVDLVAPGVGILSTTPGGNYGYLSGTSMATPHVTGVLALVWSEHPDWNYTQVINQVLNTVDKIPSLADKTITGGRLDAAAAVGSAQQSSATLQIVDSQPSGPYAGAYNAITVKFNAPVSVPSFTPGSVLLVGADGSTIPVTGITPVGGNQVFRLSFATQTRGGYYKLRVGPNVNGLSGSGMVVFHSDFYLPGGATPAPTPPPTPTPATFTSTEQANVPPNGRGVAMIYVTQDVTMHRVRIKINVASPRVSDLLIHVQAPDGTNVVLSNRRGGSTANFINTLFDDSANTTIAQGHGPFTGTYKPEAGLSTLDGKDARGVWKLWVEDKAGSNRSTVINWSLLVN